jgi:predicted lipoprotein with Yx(FWY)xxD motif
VRTALAALIVPVALLATACGSSSSSSTPTTTSGAATVAATLSTRTLPRVGAVVVNQQGRTLYVFAPDKATKVTCTGGCASVWPPLMVPSGQKPTVSVALKSSLVSSDPDPSGGRVITYNGWPLYLYVADPSAGSDHGQALNSSGGLWYVISPSGTVIKTKPSSSSSSGGASYGGGYG